jgi:geranylgeranyl diphosphate synthase type I
MAIVQLTTEGRSAAEVLAWSRDLIGPALRGLAFQFADDLLGIWGDPAVTGKPVHAELIDIAGGRTWSQAQADDLLARAMHHLRSAGPTARAAAELDALAHLATRRDH